MPEKGNREDLQAKPNQAYEHGEQRETNSITSNAIKMNLRKKIYHQMI
jgi:hypothetical protein